MGLPEIFSQWVEFLHKATGSEKETGAKDLPFIESRTMGSLQTRGHRTLLIFLNIFLSAGYW
jgi:hypothetical protein